MARRCASAAWRWLDEGTKKYPIRMKMLVGGCLSLTTELVVQKAIEKQPKVEVARCGRAAAWRMFFHVPILHTWLNFLEKHVTGASVRAVVTKKVLCDQLVASPIVHAMFFYYMTFAEGGTLQDGHQKLSDCWLRTMCFSYMLWPVAHMFTFGYVPIHHRVHFVNLVAMLWMGILSFVNQQGRVQCLPKTEDLHAEG
ncbi:Protein SYM1 [Diplonema papillatum]|nr:Protein SYM1 [Diplonema papillatum]